MPHFIVNVFEPSFSYLSDGSIWCERLCRSYSVPDLKSAFHLLCTSSSFAKRASMCFCFSSSVHVQYTKSCLQQLHVMLVSYSDWHSQKIQSIVCSSLMQSSSFLQYSHSSLVTLTPSAVFFCYPLCTIIFHYFKIHIIWYLYNF